MKPEIRNLISSVLGELSTIQWGILEELVRRYGCMDGGDLKIIKMDDLLEILTPVQAARLNEEATEIYAEMKKRRRQMYFDSTPAFSSPAPPRPSCDSPGPSYTSLDLFMPQSPNYSCSPSPSTSFLDLLGSSPAHNAAPVQPIPSASPPAEQASLPTTQASQVCDAPNPAPVATGSEDNIVTRPFIPEAPPTPWYDEFTPNIPSIFEEHLRAGTLSGRLRLDLIKHLVFQIMEMERDPLRKEVEIISKRLVCQYPYLLDCMGNTIIASGETGMVGQLMRRIENTKRKLNDRVPYNRAPRKRKTPEEREAAKKKQSKRPRKTKNGCARWSVAKPPVGENAKSQEEKRSKLAQMHNTNGKALTSEMRELQDVTYYLQRKEINSGMLSDDVGERWPTLHTVEGAVRHCETLTGQNFSDNIMANFDKYGEKLWSFFQKDGRNGHIKEIIQDIKETMDTMGTQECLYQGIVLLTSAYYAESVEGFMVKAAMTDNELDVAGNLPASPTIIYCGSSPLSAPRFMVSTDGIVVCNNITTFPAAFTMFYCMHFMMNSNYHEGNSGALDSLQRLILDINPSKGNRSTTNKGRSGPPAKTCKFFRRFNAYFTTGEIS